MTLRNAFGALATEEKQDSQITLLQSLADVEFATADGQVTLADLLQQLLTAMSVARLEAGHGSESANRSYVDAQDAYTGGQVLDDQLGADDVLTFSFATPMDLIWVRSVGGVSRADPFGNIPSPGLGVYCADDEPAPLTVRTDEVLIYAPADAKVSVWGYRYA